MPQITRNVGPKFEMSCSFARHENSSSHNHGENGELPQTYKGNERLGL